MKAGTLGPQTENLTDNDKNNRNNRKRLMKKIISTFVLGMALIATATAQNADKTWWQTWIGSEKWAEVFEPAFSHWNVGVNLGTTGIGVDVATPLTEHVRARAGFSFVPKFDYTMKFGVEVRNKDGVVLESSKFAKMAELLEQLTGTEVDQSVTMVGQPHMWNAKLLFDVYPFPNKHWHVTAGFYAGQSLIARAVNAIEDAPSLVAISMYNKMYMKSMNGEPLISYNGQDIYQLDLQNRLLEYGRMGVNLGTDKNGLPIIIEPDKRDMVVVNVKTNAFKPYLGFGYTGSPFRDESYQIGFDAGILFWGGKPSVLTTATMSTPTVSTDEWGNDIYSYDTYSIDLARDADKVEGKPGDYVKLLKAFVVYPVLEFRISKEF